MKRIIHNENGFGLPELLLAVLVLGVVTVFVIPAFAATTADAPVMAMIEVPVLDPALVESAAAYADVASPQENFTLRELVDAGYLNVELTENQAEQLVWKTESGGFLYQPE